MAPRGIRTVGSIALPLLRMANAGGEMWKAACGILTGVFANATTQLQEGGTRRWDTMSGYCGEICVAVLSLTASIDPIRGTSGGEV
jgi:hypothetical protein